MLLSFIIRLTETALLKDSRCPPRRAIADSTLYRAAKDPRSKYTTSRAVLQALFFRARAQGACVTAQRCAIIICKKEHTGDI